jgi:SSS family solute:Na+ symporter
MRSTCAHQFGNNFAVPALLLHSFPSWFVGVAFAAIGIGALVPAAIMSIAAANLYTRNIHREFINQNPTDKQESRMAKLVSLIVKVGALVFILFVPTQWARRPRRSMRPRRPTITSDGRFRISLAR